MLLPLKELKDTLFFEGGAFKGAFRGNLGHWKHLEALVEATSYRLGAYATQWDFHYNCVFQDF